MPSHARSYFLHDCNLPSELRENRIQSPYSSWFGKCGNILRMSLTVDYHIYLHRYYKSTSACRQEKIRHLKNPRYKYIIHPYSYFAKIRSRISAISYFVIYVLESFNAAFVLQQIGSGGTYVVITGEILTFCEVVLLFDVIIRFFEGYVDFKTRQIVLEQRMIAKRYLKTYFFFDAIPLVNGLAYAVYKDLVLPYLNWTRKQDRFFSFFFTQFYRLRLARTKLILDTVDVFLQNYRVRETIRTVVFLLILLFFMLHTINCTTYGTRHFEKLVKLPRNYTWRNLYVTRNDRVMAYFENGRQSVFLDHGSIFYAFYLYFFQLCVVSCYFFGLGIQMYPTDDEIELATFAIVSMCGLIFNIYVVARILELFGVMNISEKEYEQFIVNTEAFFAKRDTPRRLRNRVFQYFDCFLNGKFFYEKEILDTLSEHLQLEILLYSCAGLLNEVSLFRGLSKEASGYLMALLKKEIFLKNDVIYESTQRTGVLYFILRGTCEVIMLPHQKEAMHLEDGDLFGDINAYVEDEISTEYTIKAVEVVETFKLDVKDIEYCGRVHPEIFKKIQMMTEKKANSYSTVFAVMEAEDNTTGDIIEELRKGRILYHGIKRTDFL